MALVVFFRSTQMKMFGRRNGIWGYTSGKPHRELRLEPLESRTLLSATPTENSFHLAIFAESTEVAIPAEVGVQADDSTETLFTIDDSGTVYLETPNNQTVGDLFSIWQNNAGLAGNRADAVLTENQLLANVETGGKTVQMFVNGQLSTQFENYAVQDGDQIVLVFGDKPVLSVNTNYGPIVVELFADATPITVDNFLNYVNDDDYINSFFHRSVENFVIQGGGFKTPTTTFTDTDQFSDVPNDAPIQNEPGISNVRGTLAMATLAGNADSATCQFFVNLSDNSEILDSQNGGFTVFGQILDMTTVDQIANLSITPAASIDTTISASDAEIFSSLPLGTGNELVVVEEIVGQGEISGMKYLDGNADGNFDNGESPLAGATVYLDANDNGILDIDETRTVTGADGSYFFQVEPGTYIVRSDVSTGSVATEPLSPESYTVVVEIGRETSNHNFGVTLPVPSGIDLLAVSDTGNANDDNLTRNNNADASSVLQFLVSGVSAGADVRIFVGATLLGSQVATDDIVIVTTSGTHTLADGLHNITAVQVLGGITNPSAPLVITVDATAPAALTNEAPALARVGLAYSFDGQSPEEGLVAYSLADAPDGMTIDAATGQLAWTPTSEQAEPQSFSIVITDAAGNTTSHTVSLTVLGAIAAYPDVYTVDEDATLTKDAAAGVLANDDTTSGTLTVALVVQPAHGTVALNSDGGFEYLPAEDFHGTDTFTYRATNTGGGDSNVAAVVITVNPVNDAPVSVVDTYTVPEDATLTVTAAEGLLANDLDIDGDILTATIVTQPLYGTVTLGANGEFSYQPDSGFVGTDSFTYKVNDGLLNSSPITVTIAVTEMVTSLGAVDFLLIPHLDPSSGTLTYTLETTHDGLLTFDAMYGSATTTVTMTLYDSDGKYLAVSSALDGRQRIDWETTAGTSYSLRLAGISSDVELRIANLLHQDGTTITVYGTVAADDLLFSAEEGRNITINGVVYSYSNSEVSVVNFDADKSAADTGSDVVRVEGSELGETLTATFEGEDLVPTMVFRTNAGITLPLTVTATNFEQLFAWSRSGDADTAVFEDSPGQDKGKALPGEDVSLIRSKSGYATFYRRAKLFENVTFVGANGPDDDTIILFDTAGSDEFEANAQTRTHQLVTESGLVCTAQNFSELLVRSNYDGGTDTAAFIDSSQNDKFVARPGKARLYNIVEGHEFDLVVRDFDEATVEFTGGGIDVARLTDSAKSDSFSGTSTLSSFTGPGFAYTIKQAEQVSVTSLYDNDSDTAVIHDTSANDVLQCDYTSENRPTAQLWTPDKLGQMLYELVDIETIDAYGTTGLNRAHVVDYVQLHGLWNLNKSPVAEGDSFTIDEDNALTIDAATGVLANDTDANSDTLTAALVSAPSHGVLAFDADGSFTYTPAAEFSGTDTFTYIASDGLGNSGETTVTLTIHPVNDGPPVVADDDYAIAVNGTLTAIVASGVLANDSDVDGDTLVASLSTEPAHGTVVLNADGSFTYTPVTDFHGTDSFTYVASDGTAESLKATVTIRVNSPATPADETYSMLEDGVLTHDAASGVLANDSDLDGDTLVASLHTHPAHGTVTLSADGSFTYTPAAEFSGTDTFTYVANDGFGNSAPATVTLMVNDTPAAVGDDYSVDEDNILTVGAVSGVLNNDSDVDSTTLTATLMSAPAHGSLTLNADGSFTYTPMGNFHGTDTFTYVASDGTADSAVATVTITVLSVNDDPIVAGESYGIEVNGELIVPIVSGVLANDTDVDGDVLTAGLIALPANGTLVFNADGSFTYTPTTDFHGTDTFTYTVNDGTTTSAEATVTIVVNTPTAPVDDAYSVEEDGVLAVDVATGVLVNDASPDGDALTAALVSDPAHGTLTLNADGSFSYTPDADFHGTDTFTYVASDGTADSAVATVTIRVLSVNDPPVAADDIYSVGVNGTLTVDTAALGLLANDIDVDGNPLAATLVADVANGSLTFGSDGLFTYTPNADFQGTDVFTYTVNDGLSDSAVATVTITVA